MEVILGFGAVAFLFLVIGLLLARVESFPLGHFAIILFVGFALFAMNLMSSAIYTEWNNTNTYNSSSTNIPDTLVTLSIWSLWAYVLFVVVGALFYVFNIWTRRGAKR